MKNKRSTREATIAARQEKHAKREDKKREIIRVYCQDFCECKAEYRCSDELPEQQGIVLLISSSLKSISEHLNSHGIKTTSGKTGSWQVTTLRNTFREEYEIAKALKGLALSADELIAELVGREQTR